MYTAPDLGGRVTLTLEIAPTDRSLSGKLYRTIVSNSSLGSEPTSPWSRFDNLKILFLETKSAQILCAVNYQLAVGYRTRNESLFGLIMCPYNCCRLGKVPLRNINGSNGRPKGIPPCTPSVGTDLFRSAWLLKKKRTLGSSFLESRKFICLNSSEDDGGSVVPGIRPEPPLGRELDRSQKTKGNSVRPDSTPTPSLPHQVNDPVIIAKNWRFREPSHKGVSIPTKFSKILRISEENTSSTFRDIYQLVYDPNMLDIAYSDIKSNPGNMTKGTSSVTLDGWGFEARQKLATDLASEKFQFSRSRLVEIPKPLGGVRPLKVAPPRDKIVQRVLTNILEAIYDPAFSKSSFGFRSRLGVHDALKHISLKYQGARWFIEGDIAKCFDGIDHHVLIDILRERIKDEKFIRIIFKALRAGYLDTWKVPQDCLVGTPQGSIVSPILCNIILDKFDKFIENSLAPQYNRGSTRRQPAEYKRLMARSWYFSKQYKSKSDLSYLEKAVSLRKEAQKRPSMDPKDPNFRRLYYTRYADDWLIGFAGPRSEAEEIREKCRQFLATIKFRLNMEKTLITVATKGCIYLGTKIHVPLNQERFKKGFRLKARANLGVHLNAPILRVFKKLSAGGYCDLAGKPLPRMALFACDKDELVDMYNSVLRGILNFYSPVDNYKKLAVSLYYILRNSACKVLAAKYKTKTVRGTLFRFGKNLGKEGSRSLIDYKSPSIRGLLFKLSNPKISRVNSIFRKASLTIRLENLSCAKCGSTFLVEMHHIRHLKDLNKKLDPISRAMVARRRKQIPLCKRCHSSQHVNIRRLACSSKETPNSVLPEDLLDS
jgi:group II intron reverse transcriptase/maturase